MKTYAESQNKPPFDWNAELQKKIDDVKSGKPAHELADLASGWTTCATGQQCDAIPRDENIGWPLDDTLRHLGTRFLDDIFARCWVDAKITLAKIEARSAEILATL